MRLPVRGVLAVVSLILFAVPASPQLADFDPCRAYYCENSVDTAECIVDLRGLQGQWRSCKARQDCIWDTSTRTLDCHTNCYGEYCYEA